MAGSQEKPVIGIRPLREHAEFVEAVKLQQEVWGFSDLELLPVRLFVVATKVGGQAFGAFDGDTMIGFLLAIPGVKSTGESYLHSHMLGIRKEYQNLGLGRRMKLEQRRDALERGIRLIEWTFDPLEIRNAHFNVERLGAIMRRYLPNQYGVTTSHLHGSLPTDRLVAEWHLDSPHAEAIIAGQPFERPAIEHRIEVPAEIADLRRSDPKRAREIQHGMGEQFVECFGRGLAVTGFETTQQSGIYLLGKWPFK